MQNVCGMRLGEENSWGGRGGRGVDNRESDGKIDDRNRLGLLAHNSKASLK